MGKVDTKESGIGFGVRVVSTEASRTLIWAMKVKAVRPGIHTGVGTTTGAEAAGTEAGAPAEATLVASCLRA